MTTTPQKRYRRRGGVVVREGHDRQACGGWQGLRGCLFAGDGRSLAPACQPQRCDDATIAAIQTRSTPAQLQINAPPKPHSAPRSCPRRQRHPHWPIIAAPTSSRCPTSAVRCQLERSKIALHLLFTAQLLLSRGSSPVLGTAPILPPPKCRQDHCSKV